MKITCTIHSLCGGGAERVMAGLASRLASEHDVTLITLDRTDRDRYRCDPAVHRIGLDLLAESHCLREAILQNRRRVLELRQAIAASSPDVVLSFCDRMNIITLAASKPLGIPVVISERAQPAYQSIGIYWSLLRRWYYRWAATVVVQTKAAGKVVARWTQARQAVIAAAIDPPPASVVGRGVAEGSKILISLGRFAPEKQFERLIQAFAQLPEELNAWQLKLYGEGNLREALQAQIDELNVADRVRLLPWQSDIWSIFGQAEAFALTSRYEGFPNALLEAMAAGVPVLSVDCDSGPREIIRDGENGLLIAQDDRQALVAGLSRLLSDEGLREKLSLAARTIVDEYRWDSFVAQYVKTLQAAIANWK